ncbi:MULTISPECIES: YceI family protein [unclassified Chryseobacterium]|uniref:YceI family protein n=1 Tax=unclassified Chryseobacterium TaxID=2593645 RepID=UPI0021CD8839|nr:MULTISPECIES: YceI family protein [unclassified Chryseobacterium]
MKKILLSFAFALVSMFTFAQTTWTVDPAHSSINFNIKHMGISFVQGRFDKFIGKVETSGVIWIMLGLILLLIQKQSIQEWRLEINI